MLDRLRNIYTQAKLGKEVTSDNLLVLMCDVQCFLHHIRQVFEEIEKVDNIKPEEIKILLQGLGKAYSTEYRKDKRENE